MLLLEPQLSKVELISNKRKNESGKQSHSTKLQYIPRYIEMQRKNCTSNKYNELNDADDENQVPL